MIRVLIVLVALTRIASAHQTSVKYIDLEVDDARAHVTLKTAASDVTDVADRAAFITGWLAVRIPTAAGELACPITTPPVAHDEAGFVDVAWTATCPRAIDLITLDLGPLFALDPRIEAFVNLRVAGSDDVTPTVVRAPDSPATLHAGSTPLLRWIRDGMNHIYTGADHMSFVFALLLVVMLERRRDGWGVKPILPALRSTASVITAFTIAHSLTLISAALGWVSLPSRLVESLIAASIAYTAAENIVRPDVRWRFALTFGFGLAHGLGFAATLAVDLPPHGVVPPLLCFNVGVELAQLTIVLIALPLLYVLASTVGAERYRRVAMPVMSASILAFGLMWVIERAFGM